MKKGILRIVTYIIAVACVVVLLKLNFLFSTLLFFLPPSIYVTVKKPSLFRPLTQFSILVGLPIVLGVDSIALLNNAWWETSILGTRIFGLVTYENALWAVLYTYFITSLYEYFLADNRAQAEQSSHDDKEREIKFPRKFWVFEIFLLVSFFTFIVIFFTHKTWLIVPHFYTFFIAIFYGIPTVIGLIRSPKKYVKLWTSCLYFSVMLFVGELASLTTKQWGFDGTGYLGIIHIGTLHLPVEEMLWILFGAPAFIQVYNFLTSKNESH